MQKEVILMAVKTSAKRPAQRKGAKRPQAADWRTKQRRSRGQGPHSYSVVEAGRMVGLSKSASYRAIHLKQIPAIEVNGGWIVPRAIWDRMLGLETPAEIERTAKTALQSTGA
jgi:hypothetical protein